MKLMQSGLLLFLLTTFVCVAAPSAIEDAAKLEERGKFREAAAALKAALASGSPDVSQSKALEFELDRLERIRRDYPMSGEALFDALKESVRGITKEEFERWVGEGRFDSREIDGERRFMVSSVSNLYFRHAELESRRLKPKDETDFEKAILKNCRAIAEAVKAENKPYVLPKRFHAEMVVVVKSNVVPAGEIVSVWLPIPRAYPFQTDFKLAKTSWLPKHIEKSSSPIRSLFMEHRARAGRPVEFRAAYDYTVRGVKFELKPEQIREADLNDAELKRFMGEAPHVIFTPEMRALSEQIAGGESNPMLKAKRFYNWISENIKYSYATEYSTIRNISEYCRANGYGDCGQEALLFITLCRMNGIPARWQSGWFTHPLGKSIHDWCEIYLAPGGWMPVDPYMGIWAMRYARTFTEEEKREVRDFYFGGLDQWRMIANSDHSQELKPPKKSFRSDNVDFQRGELEWGTNNIYFDDFSYQLNVKEFRINSNPVNN